ncbi:MAG: TolC family outer membrane protein [Arenimonas sp.]
MSLRLRPLAFALLLAGVAAPAAATDLVQAYDLARQGDPQLSISESQVGVAGEGIVQNRANLLPQIDGTATYGRSRSDSDGTQLFGSTPFTSDTSNSSTSRSKELNLRQSIYDRANYTRLGASRARAAAARADADSASDNLIVRVADAYFNVLTRIETLVASRAEVSAVKRQLDQAEKRLEVGLAPITDVHEARARYDSARANAILAANSLDDAYEALTEITGERVSNLKGLAKDFTPKATDLRARDAFVDIALASNPTIKSRELALAAAEKDVSTARAGHLPTLGGSFSWRDSSNNGDNTNNLVAAPNVTAFDNGFNGTTWGLSLNVPIFSGFATQSRVREALHRRDIAADQLEQQKRAITRTTRSLHNALAAGAAEVEARRLAVVSAQAAYEAGEAGLEVGTRTIVDVLIAQQQLFQAQRDYATARHAFLVNELKLKQAAGILEATDLEAVNRSLVTDADAALGDATN